MTSDIRSRIESALPAAGAFCVFVLAMLLSTQLSTGPSTAPARLAPLKDSLNELTARYTWGMVVLGYLIAAVGATVLAAYFYFSNRASHWSALIAAVTLGLVAIVYKFSPSFQHFILSTLLLDPTVYAQLPSANGIGTAIDVAAAAVIATAVIAMCGSLGRLPAPAGEPPATASWSPGNIADLALQIRRLRVLLIATAIVLALGVIEVGTLYNWGAVIANEPPKAPQTLQPFPYRAAAASMSNVAAVLAGAFYSLLLAGMFIPAFAVARARARQAALASCPAGATEPELEDFFTKHDLDTTIPKRIAAVLAMLTPAMVGIPGTALLKLIA